MQDAIKEMFVDPEVGDLTTSMGEAANSQTWYTAKGGINWLKLCTTRVCDTYFRDTGEVTADHVLANGIPIVQIRNQNFMDSLSSEERREGKSVSVRVDLGGRRIIKKKTQNNPHKIRY